ncbi:MAG: pyridoxal phosphate-dependent aminotransferase [Anaerocolumna sp.]
MDYITEKFARLGVDHAPGQEVRQEALDLGLLGDKLDGPPVDFSHGDVNAFVPTPGAFEAFTEGYKIGGAQAYTEYRGKGFIREDLAAKLAAFTGAPVSAQDGLILTPGTQGALFLAMGAMIGRGDKVAIVEPDYFANRKLVEFFDGELVPVQMDYWKGAKKGQAGLDLTQLEEAFKKGVKLFQFSNPNNPTGVIYSREEIIEIAKLAEKYGVAVIVDELYSRQIFDNRIYTHLRTQNIVNPDNLITIIGPSKTESLSGFRLGVAFGSPRLITRMEKLQAIVSLRCSGYNQAVFKTWFSEPEGWMAERVAAHQAIRDDLLNLFRASDGISVRTPEGGSYIFPGVKGLKTDIRDFVKILRLQAAVTVTPGTEFGPQFTDSFRLNFSQDAVAAHHAVERISKMIERYR